MSDQPQDKTGEDLPPSQRKARKLIEEMAAREEETQEAAGYQQAQAFLDSVWQGKAVSRIPRQAKPDDDPKETETG